MQAPRAARWRRPVRPVTLRSMYIGLSIVGIAAAWALLVAGVEPVPTWFYVLVWYPTLTLADGIASRIRNERPLLWRPGLTASLFLWSPLIWLVFEAINFRIANWYYVFLPANPVERWTGIVISFATVVPAVVLAERLLRAVGAGRRWHTAPIVARAWELHAATGIGVGCTLLVLLVPHRFFPLAWGAVWLLADPYVYRRRPEWSLLHDVTTGEWGRMGRLALGGLGIGLLWEFYNLWARGKWIYTVPWLEQLKLFEMPPFGFLGFPFFALEAWSLYHALCVLRLALPVEATPRSAMTVGAAAGSRSHRDRREGRSRRRVLVAAAAALGISAATLLGMERWTISSVVPRLADLPAGDARWTRPLRDAGIATPFALARMDPARVGHLTRLPDSVAQELVATARLVTLRGIGATHARGLARLGVRTVCQLSARDPAAVWAGLHAPRPSGRSAAPHDRPTAAEVRVWVRSARRECAETGSR